MNAAFPLVPLRSSRLNASPRHYHTQLHVCIEDQLFALVLSFAVLGWDPEPFTG